MKPGGMSTRIHAAVDGNGQPTTLFLSPGQAADCTAAETLLADFEAGMTVIADKAYDTNAILDHLAAVGATAGETPEESERIPAKSAAPGELERETFSFPFPFSTALHGTGKVILESWF